MKGIAADRATVGMVAMSLFLVAAGCAKDPSGDEPGGGSGGDNGGGSGGDNGGSGGSTDPGAGMGFGTPETAGSGSSNARYENAQVKRDGVSYLFMANGWGPGFMSQSVSWTGTAFTVVSMQGKQGPNWEPASYPTVFCGAYSNTQSGACGLPKAISAIGSLKTGWSWSPNGNTGQYNAAYDIWIGNSESLSSHSAFLMVWLRDPGGQQPAGTLRKSNLTVGSVPGTWNLWAGVISGKPCISYTRAERNDTTRLEFDVMEFINDLKTNHTDVPLPGSTVLSVAIGFEMWNGPITNLASHDFYVDVK